MKRTVLGIALVFLSLLVSNKFGVLAGCGDTWQKQSDDTTSGTCGPVWGDIRLITYVKHWRIFWVDGYERNDAQAKGIGECYSALISDTHCPPRFATPRWPTHTAS